jgi:hypothetical protein
MTPLETRVFELEGYVSKLHTEMEELHKQIAELRDRKITVTTSSAFDPAAAARTIEEAMKTKAPSAPRPPVPHASGRQRAPRRRSPSTSMVRQSQKTSTSSFKTCARARACDETHVITILSLARRASL